MFSARRRGDCDVYRIYLIGLCLQGITCRLYNMVYRCRTRMWSTIEKLRRWLGVPKLGRAFLCLTVVAKTEGWMYCSAVFFANVVLG